MKSKYFNAIADKLSTHYQLDIVDDILLAREDRVILVADIQNPPHVILEVIAGSLTVLGFKESSQIDLETLLAAFDYDNSYGEVAGKQAYYDGVRWQLYDFKHAKDVSFPIRSTTSRKWLRFNITPSAKNPAISIFTITDVTRLHTQEEETFAKTHHDSLTGLFNKYTFDYHYGLMYNQPDFHVMYMDIDNFKLINDHYGHSIGNQCLVAMSVVLKCFESKNCHFYRIGGDEFLGLMIGSETEIRRLAETIVHDVRKLAVSPLHVPLTISMGVMKATKSEDLARKADNLMYIVKQTGKNNYLYEIER